MRLKVDMFTEHRFNTQDGKSLYYREYGDPISTKIPILCLPGLSRNSRDFHDIAYDLSKMRRVICPDYRGRGLSDYDNNHKNYHPRNLLEDLWHLIVASNVQPFVAIGTSMGGMLACALGIKAPSYVRGVILNDIGPVISSFAAKNILNILERDHPQENWSDAILAVKQMLPGLNLCTKEEWLSAAEGTFRKGNDGKLHIDWDPTIVKPIRQQIPSDELWLIFKSLRPIPVLGLRGEKSNIVSSEIFKDMMELHGNFTSITIADKGHTPSLNEPEARSAIQSFLSNL